MLAMRLAENDAALAVGAVVIIVVLNVYITATMEMGMRLVRARMLAREIEPLTGLLNRRAFDEQFATLIGTRSRDQAQISPAIQPITTTRATTPSTVRFTCLARPSELGATASRPPKIAIRPVYDAIATASCMVGEVLRDRCSATRPAPEKTITISKPSKAPHKPGRPAATADTAVALTPTTRAAIKAPRSIASAGCLVA